MPAYRKSALLLHGLRARDQRWLLAQLPSPQRAILQSLLSELKALGIQPSSVDRVLLDKSRSANTPTFDAEQLASIDSISDAEIRSLLQHESPQVVAAILSIHSWSWSAQLLSNYPRQRHIAVVRAIELGRRQGLSSQLQHAILASLVDMVDAQREQHRQRYASGHQFSFRRHGGFLGLLRRSLWPA